jgi:hypothetical protein
MAIYFEDVWMPVNECDTPALEIEPVERETCGQQTVVARSVFNFSNAQSVPT